MAGVHHSPQLKELERAREVQVLNAAKVQALFQYLVSIRDKAKVSGGLPG